MPGLCFAFQPHGKCQEGTQTIRMTSASHPCRKERVGQIYMLSFPSFCLAISVRGDTGGNSLLLIYESDHQGSMLICTIYIREQKVMTKSLPISVLSPLRRLVTKRLSKLSSDRTRRISTSHTMHLPDFVVVYFLLRHHPM